MNRFSVSRRIVISIAVVIMAIVSVFVILNQFYISYIWFKEMGYTQVFMKELLSKIQMGIPLFVVSFIFLYLYFKYLTKMVSKKVFIIEKIYRKAELVISLITSFLLSMLLVNSLWYKLLESTNSTNFGLRDPLFGKDIAFYVFQLPLLEQLYSAIMASLFIIFLATILYSAFLYLANPNRHVDSNDGEVNIKGVISSFIHLAGRQIGIFCGIFLLIVAFGYYIKGFTLLYSTSGIAYGASYTDVKITLPLYRIGIVLSIVFGLLSIYFGIRRKLKPILLGPIILVVISILGHVITFGIDYFIVAPNEYEKEEPYLVRNIEYTQSAYGIDKVKEKQFPVDNEITLNEIKENELTIKNIPINDYRPTLSMFNSIQGFRVYYEFMDIDIDRYDVNGEYTQVFISAREMNNNRLEDKAKTWINTHLKYTHGYGVVVSPVNTVNEAGQPSLVVKDIPPETDKDALKVSEPRIYYGESTNTYAITNCKTKEFDYPEGSENAENYYQGTGGIKLNFMNRVLFTMYHGDLKILLSSDITSESRMHIKRNIMDRVSTIAPFLAYDEDPYIVIADGKLYWIVDGFTTSKRYPYSQPYDEQNSFNYIRNSVKVVVDAYNGDVSFYQVDPQDPIVNTYNKIYPNMFKPVAEMPQSLQAHIRYSQGMFDIQSNIYRVYHMNNPRVFYNKEDQWEIANQVYGQEKQIEDVESAYLIMKEPDGVEEEFVLMVPYTPRQKDNMIGWMAAMNDVEKYGELIVYKFPKQNLAYGPMQIEQRIDQDTNISPQLTLLGQQGSEISRGNMLTIPINNSILYVEPVYIGASGTDSSIPEVKKVIVSYANKIVMEDHLDLALEKLFGIEEQTPTKEEQTPTIEEDINSLIAKAKELFNKAQEASQAGNWAEYGNFIHELEKVLNQLDAIG